MSKGPAWLLEQLPTLQREGVLDAAATERLRLRYASQTDGIGVSRLLFAGLGAVLVGLGLILLAAHNWGDWSRTTRLGVSLAPLLLSQLAIFAVLRMPQAPALWREPLAVLAALAFALALAMVGQVFHLPGDLGTYLLTCAALTLPLVYLLRSVLAAVLYGVALLAAVMAAAPLDEHPMLVVAAYSLLLPHLWQSGRAAHDSARFTLTLTMLVPLLFAAVLASLPDALRLGLWWLAVFGALLVLVDAQQRRSPLPLWRRPLAAYGTLAVAVAALIGSFAEAWRLPWRYPDASQLTEAWLLLSVFLGVALWLAVVAARRGQWVAALQVVPALLMALLAAFDTRPWALPLAWLLSAVVLVIAIAMLRDGLQQRQWGGASRGLFLISVLVLLRFLDGDWSFTVRDTVFVVTGVAFLVTSAWLRKRMDA